MRQRAIAGLVLGMLSGIAFFLGVRALPHRGVYLLAFSLLIGIGAVVIGITALVKARRTGSYRPRGAIGGIIFGVLATMMCVPTLGLYLAFPRQVSTYVRCVAIAQTTAQQQACQRHFSKSVTITVPGGQGHA